MNAISPSTNDADALGAALADCLLDLAGCSFAWMRRVIVELSCAVQQGHACVPMVMIPDMIAQVPHAPSDVGHLLSALLDTGLVGVPGSESPLICDGERLYLRRYFEYERRVAEALLNRAYRIEPLGDGSELHAHLKLVFPTQSLPGPDWQVIAAQLVLRSALTVICGGPGTGKTWLVLRLLALLQLQAPHPLRIALAAPTGKAAARLSESLNRDLIALPVAESIKTQIPRSAITLHRLLGTHFLSTQARHHQDAPLALDVLVLDEVSMVDLPSMARVLAALPQTARLILIGDPDQLAAVEAGCVLSELRDINPNNAFSAELANRLAAYGYEAAPAEVAAPPISDCVVTLARSHRHAAGVGIDKLLAAIRMGQGDAMMALLQEETELSLIEPASVRGEWADQLLQLTQRFRSEIRQANEPMQALQALARFRLLCAVREGSRGTRSLNAIVACAHLGLKAWQEPPDVFHGAPLLVTANDHALGLYNGDTGIVWRDGSSLRAWFNDGQGQLRHFAKDQLPDGELSYAMTVHKAQGSEFENVILVLPQAPHPLLTRQWLYTACSRARSRLTILGNETVLRASLSHSPERGSGLGALLRKQSNHRV